MFGLPCSQRVDILSRNGTLILGMVWTIILHYSTRGETMKEIKHTLANWVEEMGVTGAFPKEYA